jgi:hypothetical protein
VAGVRRGELDCVCTKCGWSRQLVADNQGAAGPLHVAIHIGHCCAPPTDEEFEAARISVEEQLVLDEA